MSKFEATIPDFHNLSFRYQQFQEALAQATPERKEVAQEAIDYFLNKQEIVATYDSLLQDPDFPDRLMHHDTKINNVLLDTDTQQGLAVCDLDTLMPGKVISDLGDMVRTYVSPVSEESTDFEKVIVREDYYQALVEGYLSEMKTVLTETEKSAIFYSGLFLVYMQGIRFLADYLNGDVYYPIKYPTHNLDRARNQMVLLQDLYAKEEVLREIIASTLTGSKRCQRYGACTYTVGFAFVTRFVTAAATSSLPSAPVPGTDSRQIAPRSPPGIAG